MVLILSTMPSSQKNRFFSDFLLELFYMQKVKLFPYNKKFSEIFQKEKRSILKILSDVEIHHIGSTAVPNLGGKGMIDIMIAIKDWRKNKSTVNLLKELGFTHIHPEEKRRIFLSRIGPTKYGDIHIHLVEKNSEGYREMLFFRDYMRTHEKEAQEYLKTKQQSLKKYKADRNKYTISKEKYIKEILKRVK